MSAAHNVSPSWISRLIDAVNSDNDNDETPCSALATRQVLAEAPASFSEHARLALADIATAGDQPLHRLRSDTVATEFAVRSGARRRNVLVARMTVPGGPWPGHFGLEAVVFDAYQEAMPEWFPVLDSKSQLLFADTIAASNGFQWGQGAVLFPELLALRQPIRRQAFGVVFLDRLTTLYVNRVLPVVEQMHITPALPEDSVRELRRIAFLAHEWGHFSNGGFYELTVHARRRRLMAIISELHADLSALMMLLRSAHPLARHAAVVLTLDRIVREAWLPRAQSQVDSAAAKTLLSMLADGGAIVAQQGAMELRLPDVAVRLERERDALQRIVTTLTDGAAEQAQHYLVAHGWQVEDDKYRLTLSDGLSQRLQACVKQLSAAGDP